MKAPFIFFLLISLTVWSQDADDLLGNIQRSDLETGDHKSWFDENFEAHLLDNALIQDLKNALHEIEVTVFMGTWCSDSQREVPAFFKIIDALNTQVNIRMIAVDEDKLVPDGSATEAGITHVPTFIFSDKGKEINRIVEFPIMSLEQDMLDILQGKEYKHAYEY